MNAGRHRTFDKREALDKAMKIFWVNGFNGTSLSDLTEALGINKPSLYAAFGNKEQLYISALNHYLEQYGLPHAKILLASEKPLREKVRDYLRSVVGIMCHPDLPGGCLLSMCSTESGGSSIPQDALRSISEINCMTKNSLLDFFSREQAQGHLSTATTPAVLTLFLMALNNGMAVLARNGATQLELEQLIEHSVSTL